LELEFSWWLSYWPPTITDGLPLEKMAHQIVNQPTSQGNQADEGIPYNHNPQFNALAIVMTNNL
jgi:hypothetical protein